MLDLTPFKAAFQKEALALLPNLTVQEKADLEATAVYLAELAPRAALGEDVSAQAKMVYATVLSIASAKAYKLEQNFKTALYNVAIECVVKGIPALLAMV